MMTDASQRRPSMRQNGQHFVRCARRQRAGIRISRKYNGSVSSCILAGKVVRLRWLRHCWTSPLGRCGRSSTRTPTTQNPQRCEGGYGRLQLLKQPLYSAVQHVSSLLQGAHFREHRVQAVLRELLKERLEGQVYDPVRGSQTTKQLAGTLQMPARAHPVRGVCSCCAAGHGYCPAFCRP